MRATVCILLSAVAMTANAQASSKHQEIDLAVTYSAEYSNLTSGSNFWRQGGGIEFSAEAFHGLGVAANVTGTHINTAVNSGVPLTTITTTFGPRYMWSKRKFVVFSQGLIGESHGTEGIFPSTTGTLDEWNSFALQVGGGVDIRIAHHFAVRAIQADWIRTQFPNGATNVQNTLRLGAGIVLRLSE
jgi:opacity protein-like surface antigen